MYDATNATCLARLHRAGDRNGATRVKSGPTCAVSYSPDRRHLISGCHDGRIERWDLNCGGARVGQLLGHSGLVLALAHSNDGSLLASGGQDQTIRIWGLRKGECMCTLRGLPGPVLSLQFGEDNTQVIVGCHVGSLEMMLEPHERVEAAQPTKPPPSKPSPRRKVTLQPPL